MQRLVALLLKVAIIFRWLWGVVAGMFRRTK